MTRSKLVKSEKEEMLNKIIAFRDERNWKQFHTPENLAKSISIEAAELLEHFQWDNKFSKQEVCEELADVLIYSILMAESLDVDIFEIINTKIDKNATKYPVEKAKGNSKKYTEMED